MVSARRPLFPAPSERACPRGGGGCQKALFDVYRARCEREFPPWPLEATAPRQLEEATLATLVRLATQCAEPAVRHGFVVVTTSGMDGPRIAGQLAMGFDLSHSDAPLDALNEPRRRQSPAPGGMRERHAAR
mmetsp:Transcript_25678/g.86311  ORF Transcript_25678/g.86311 Transcript_25678/m.86311 type:complete len:132 (+) Transcript_25678:450-845(+)